jgi:DNA-binding CsgD family transcriptional regulator
LTVEGATSAAIAAKLALSPKTVDTYRSRLMEKLGMQNLPELVRFAIKRGILPLDQ